MYLLGKKYSPENAFSGVTAVSRDRGGRRDLGLGRLGVVSKGGLEENWAQIACDVG